MDYNTILADLKVKEIELVNKAKKDGFTFINGEFVKDGYEPVIEVYARGESMDESYGRFWLTHKIQPLSIDQLEDIKNVDKNAESIVDDLVYGEILDELDLDTFYEILYLNCGGELQMENIYRVVTDLDECYHVEEPKKLYMEFFFKSENIDGFISVYNMPTKDLEQHEPIDVFTKKYLTWN